ncbi:MAG: Gx transporter family protein [Clostridia bacterium]|nr:Gx transporter family protein [Clostridia bacterium]
MSSEKPAAKKIAAVAILTALSLVCFLLENLLPPIIIPGAKLGLANIFSLTALLMYTPVEAFAVVIIRTIFGALFAGNFSAVLYSFTGGVVSMAVSSILIYLVYPKISIMSVSIAAAAAHNITQCAVFAALSGSVLMFGYMPVLALVGILSGAVIGAVVLLIFRGVPRSVFLKVIYSRQKYKEIAKESAGQAAETAAPGASAAVADTEASADVSAAGSAPDGSEAPSAEGAGNAEALDCAAADEMNLEL